MSVGVPVPKLTVKEAATLTQTPELPAMGQLARSDGTPISETDDQRLLRWLSAAVANGCAYEYIVRHGRKRFGLSVGEIRDAFERLAQAAREEIDDEDMIELVIHSNLQRLRKRIVTMGKLAEIDVDALAGVDGSVVLDAAKVSIAAAKEERAGVQTLTDLLARRSTRWNVKTQVDVRHFDGVTAEQNEALRRIMGESTTDTKEEE